MIFPSLLFALIFHLQAGVAVARGGGTMAGEEEVRVLSFNILFGGDQYGPLLRVAEVIRTSQAHVVAIQVPRRPCLPSPRDRPPPTDAAADPTRLGRSRMVGIGGTRRRRSATGRSGSPLSPQRWAKPGAVGSESRPGAPTPRRC